MLQEYKIFVQYIPKHREKSNMWMLFLRESPLNLDAGFVDMTNRH